jgi:crossover junction endodeoxyribonuclease RusA
VSGIEVRVLGTPAPQGSKRHVGRGIIVESSKAVKPWREAIVGACERTGAAGARLDVPVDIRITFWLPRPASHRTPRGVLRASAPLVPGKKPDLDKLERSTLDGLVQADVLADDSLVVTLHTRKRYADDTSPGAHIHITTHAPEQETAA